MSAGLPKHFDPERLAAQGQVLNGSLDTAAMPRLAEALARGEPPPVARVELRAGRDEAKRLLLTGTASANLPLVCQRCMEAVMHDVDARIRLAVVRDENAERQLPAELDPLLLQPGGEVDLSALVEDELLLALPAVPMHDNPEHCGERARLARDNETESGSAKRENPFAVLKKLKTRKQPR